MLFLTFIIFANTFVFPSLPPSFLYSPLLGLSCGHRWLYSRSLGVLQPCREGTCLCAPAQLSLGAENPHVPISPCCFYPGKAEQRLGQVPIGAPSSLSSTHVKEPSSFCPWMQGTAAICCNVKLQLGHVGDQSSHSYRDF